MRRLHILLVCLILMGIAVIPSVIGTEVFSTATCTAYSFRFVGSGYSCVENTGAIRTFQNPDAYLHMTIYYAPIQATEPLYTFVTGSATEGLSGN